MRFVFRLAAVAAVGITTLGTASAQINFSDNFNSENGGSSALNYTGFTQWNVSNGTVDLYPFYGSLGVDLDGSSGNAGDLSTKTFFTLAPGSYTLSFDLGKNGSGMEDMFVRLGSVYNERFVDSLAYDSPVRVVRNFTVAAAAGSAPLVFDYDEAYGDNQGYTIDNVSLTSTPLAAPEPASLVLIGVGLVPGGIALLRRRSR